MNTSDKKPDPWTSKVSDGSNSATIAIIVAALVLVVGLFIFLGSSSTPTGPQLTENQPAPAPTTEPATPPPAAPPANEPATAPATPPADAPAADP